MIGIFDSGLGGLIVLKKLIKKLPQYDYVYFGDTAYLPYGNKSQEVIYQRTSKAVDFLFKKGCHLIILACHTASSQALRKIQKEYLPKNYPERRVLGVTIPLCEKVISNFSENLRVILLATRSTCNSKSFEKEFKKLNPKIKVICQPAPLLVPIIEEGKLNWKGLYLCLEEYLRPLIKEKTSFLVLGCTHFSLIKNKISKILKRKIRIISADEILPLKLKNYFFCHPKIENKISKRRKRSYFVTDINPNLEKIAKNFFGKKIKVKLIKI